MLQRFTRAKGYALAPGDTSAHTFTETAGGLVYLTTPAANVGTVTVREVGGTCGLVLGAGVGVTIPVVALGPVLHLNAFEYQLSSAGDILNVLLLG